LHALGVAMKQVTAQFLFKIADLPAQCRLDDVKSSRGLGYAAAVRYG